MQVRKHTKRDLPDMIRIEKVNESNVENYLRYLHKAMALEPQMMCAEAVDEEGIRARLKDAFYAKTTSLLAFDGDEVVGRIEYHFYGVLQDGYRMAYVDWVYVLPEARHKGIAQELFCKMREDCERNGINQYYLIRATNPEADRFYHAFEGAELQEAPLLRKYLKD